jgi:hypothetical protein
MKNIILLPFLFLILTQVHGQSDTLNNDNNAHKNLHAYLIDLMQIQGNDSILYDPPNLGYTIIVPKWWNIIEPPSPLIFAGSFPAVDSIENAMAIKSFPKENFDNNYKDFIDWVIKEYQIGDIPKWSNTHKLLLRNEIDEFKELGPAFKVQLSWRGTIYNCCYIITETPKAYIWIDFTATPTTYDINFTKFKELVRLFKIIK